MVEYLYLSVGAHIVPVLSDHLTHRQMLLLRQRPHIRFWPIHDRPKFAHRHYAAVTSVRKPQAAVVCPPLRERGPVRVQFFLQRARQKALPALRIPGGSRNGRVRKLGMGRG